jgi:DNA-binding MarR family transcriptional regulator
MPQESSTAENGPIEELGSVDALVQLSFLIQSVLTRAGAAHDLSVSQLRLLGIIRDRDAGMLELAAYLGLDKSSVTGLIDRAEKRSLVKRARAAGDGRSLRVSMTSTGLELAAVVEARIRAEIAALTEPLSARQQAQLTALATAVIHAQRQPRAR